MNILKWIKNKFWKPVDEDSVFLRNEALQDALVMFYIDKEGLINQKIEMQILMLALIFKYTDGVAKLTKEEIEKISQYSLAFYSDELTDELNIYYKEKDTIPQENDADE